MRAADRGHLDDLPVDQLDPVLGRRGCRPRPCGSRRRRRSAGASGVSGRSSAKLHRLQCTVAARWAIGLPRRAQQARQCRDHARPGRPHFGHRLTRACTPCAETILCSQERKTLTQFYPNYHRPLTFACHNPFGVRRYGAGRSCGPVPPPASPQSATNNAIRRATIMSASRSASLLVACAAATAVLAGSAVPVQAEERTCRG